MDHVARRLFNKLYPDQKFLPAEPYPCFKETEFSYIVQTLAQVRASVAAECMDADEETRKQILKRYQQGEKETKSVHARRFSRAKS